MATSIRTITTDYGVKIGDVIMAIIAEEQI